MTRRIIIILTFFFIFTGLIAQEKEPEDASVNSQMWLDFNGKYHLEDTRNISGFIGYRTISPRIFDKLIVVPTYNIIHTKAPKFLKREKPLIYSFHLGTGLYYTNNINEPDNFEFRMMNYEC